MKILRFVLLVVMLLGLTTTVQAQFTLATNADNSLTIVSYTGSNGVVIIPESIGDSPVTDIGDWAFYAANVTNVLIPDSVTNIGSGVFFDCESLTNVTLGSGVANVGDWAFAFCSSLSSVSCRGDAPSLGGDNVFYGNLATVYYLSEATGWGTTFDSHPAILWNPSAPFTYATNDDGVTLTITGYIGSDNDVIIPDSINFLPVDTIGVYAFLYSSITHVLIPDSITSLGDGAFLGCSNLNNVAIPNSVTNMDDGAFAECTSLTEVTLSTNLFNIGEGNFYGCTKLAGITLPDSITYFGNSAFAYCVSLTNIVIPSSVTSIGYGVFQNCTALTSIIIPDSVAWIGDGAFSFCTNLDVYIAGNAPGGAGIVFYKSSNIIVYHLPGTTGWDDWAWYPGIPSVLWLPQIQAMRTNSGGQTNPFCFNINWASGQTVIVEACTNLSNPDWQPVQTNTLTTGSAYFNDPQWTNYPGRFYRLRSP